MLVSHDAATHISNVMRVTADRLTFPAEWNPSEWQRAIVVGSGLSALASRATLSRSRLKRNVYQDPQLVRRRLRTHNARLIGVSLSGSSAEVQAAFALARESDTPHALLTEASDRTAITLPQSDAPRSLRHFAICVALSRLLGVDVTLPEVRPCTRLAHVLD